MIMRQVREMMERNKERLIKEEAMMNGEPNADLSPRSLAAKIAKPIEDVKEIMDYVQNQGLDLESRTKIKVLLKESLVESIPYFKQTFPYRLVKIHKAEHSAWNSDTIRWLYEFLDLTEQVKNKESRMAKAGTLISMPDDLQ